jgi:hypothetical protein
MLHQFLDPQQLLLAEHARASNNYLAFLRLLEFHLKEGICFKANFLLSVI